MRSKKKDADAALLADAADEVTWHKVIERQTGVTTVHVQQRVPRHGVLYNSIVPRVQRINSSSYRLSRIFVEGRALFQYIFSERKNRIKRQRRKYITLFFDYH